MTRILERLRVTRLWHDDRDELWRLMRTFAAPVVGRLAPACAYGVERIPATGGVVIAANHFSGVDHPLIAAFCPRPVSFASKAELLETPLLGEVLAWTGAFPVRRGEPDRAALRHAAAIARDGDVVVVHLEGTRQRDGAPGPFKAGAILIAIAAGVPVVPCGLATHGWSPLRGPRSVVVFGEPLLLDCSLRGRHAREDALRRVGDEVTRLWRAAVAAQAAGCPPRLPDGAGRRGFARPTATPPLGAPARAAAARPARAGRGRRAAPPARERRSS